MSLRKVGSQPKWSQISTLEFKAKSKLLAALSVVLLLASTATFAMPSKGLEVITQPSDAQGKPSTAEQSGVSQVNETNFIGDRSARSKQETSQDSSQNDRKRDGSARKSRKGKLSNAQIMSDFAASVGNSGDTTLESSGDQSLPTLVKDDGQGSSRDTLAASNSPAAISAKISGTSVESREQSPAQVMSTTQEVSESETKPSEEAGEAAPMIQAAVQFNIWEAQESVTAQNQVSETMATPSSDESQIETPQTLEQNSANVNETPIPMSSDDPADEDEIIVSLLDPTTTTVSVINVDPFLAATEVTSSSNEEEFAATESYTTILADFAPITTTAEPTVEQTTTVTSSSDEVKSTESTVDSLTESLSSITTLSSTSDAVETAPTLAQSSTAALTSASAEEPTTLESESVQTDQTPTVTDAPTSISVEVEPQTTIAETIAQSTAEVTPATPSIASSDDAATTGVEAVTSSDAAGTSAAAVNSIPATTIAESEAPAVTTTFETTTTIPVTFTETAATATTLGSLKPLSIDQAQLNSSAMSLPELVTPTSIDSMASNPFIALATTESATASETNVNSVNFGEPLSGNLRGSEGNSAESLESDVGSGSTVSSGTTVGRDMGSGSSGSKDSQKSASGLSTNAIIGVVIGSICGAVLLIAAFVAYRRKSKRVDGIAKDPRSNASEDYSGAAGEEAVARSELNSVVMLAGCRSDSSSSVNERTESWSSNRYLQQWALPVLDQDCISGFEKASAPENAVNGAIPATLPPLDEIKHDEFQSVPEVYILKGCEDPGESVNGIPSLKWSQGSVKSDIHRPASSANFDSQLLESENLNSISSDSSLSSPVASKRHTIKSTVTMSTRAPSTVAPRMSLPETPTTDYARDSLHSSSSSLDSISIISNCTSQNNRESVINRAPSSMYSSNPPRKSFGRYSFTNSVAASSAHTLDRHKRYTVSSTTFTE